MFSVKFHITRKAFLTPGAVRTSCASVRTSSPHAPAPARSARAGSHAASSAPRSSRAATPAAARASARALSGSASARLPSSRLPVVSYSSSPGAASAWVSA